jgi:hypothetical protein
MKKLLFLGACLVAFASQPVLAQTGGPEVVVVRFGYVGASKLRAYIARGADKVEEQENPGKNRMPDEAAFCQQLITKLYQEGYTLKGSFSTGNIPPASMVFVKDK